MSVMTTFEQWWESYWTNSTDTVEHTISRSIAYDAWWAARRNARGGVRMSETKGHDLMCPAIPPYAETLCECALIAKVKADIWAEVEALPERDIGDVIRKADVFALLTRGGCPNG